MTNGETYDRTTIVLHWTTAILVAVLWIIGQTADRMSDGPVKTDYWSVHVVLGFALAVLIAWRMVWRRSGGQELPAADAGPMRVVAKATHHGLYLLLLIVIVLGVVNAFVRGYNLFDLANLPQIGDRALRKPITQWHGLAANVLMGLAGLHAAAALFHHYFLRDGVLARMLPGNGGSTEHRAGRNRG
ncbi:MAG: cytochrome b/b6 domain-containing protein [Roseiarcus sp.]